MKEEFLKFKSEYAGKINENIKEAMPYLIESFVEYYGEENRHTINKRFQSIVFFYYICDSFIESSLLVYEYYVKEIWKMTTEILEILEISVKEKQILDDNFKPVIFEFIFGKNRFFNSKLENLKILSFDYKYKDLSSEEERDNFVKELFNTKELLPNDRLKIEKCIKYIENNLEELICIEKKIKQVKPAVKISKYAFFSDFYNQSRDVILKNFYRFGEEKLVGLSEPIIVKYHAICDYIYAIILRGDKDYQPIEFNLPIDVDYLLSLIGLPIFIATDKDFIHEINHAVRSSILGISNNDNNDSIFDRYIVKSGVCLDPDERFRKTEELLCDFSALKIYNIFKKKYNKAIFDDYILKDVFVDVYTEKHILIKNFYNMFKKIIDYTSITTNLDYLSSYVGKENFNRLADFINLNYYDSDYSDDKLLQLNEIIDSMKLWAKKKTKKIKD